MRTEYSVVVLFCDEQGEMKSTVIKHSDAPSIEPLCKLIPHALRAHGAPVRGNLELKAFWFGEAEWLSADYAVKPDKSGALLVLVDTKVRQHLDLGPEDLSGVVLGLHRELAEKARTTQIDNTRDADQPESGLYFISYAHANHGKANQVELMLRRENRRTWRDETDLRAGAPLVSSLYDGIEQAHTFVCLLSKQYIQSGFCMAELERAVHRQVEGGGSPRVIALRIEDCEIPNLLSAGLWLDSTTKHKLSLAVAKALKDE